MNRRKLADGSWIYVDPRGAMRSYELGKGVVLHVCRGIQVEQFALCAMEDGERQIRQFGRSIFMVDTFEAPRVETGFRDRMTEWFRRNRPQAEAHVLLRSKLLEMAISVGNLFIGTPTVKAYSNVATWEAVGRRSIPEFRRRPFVLTEDLSDPARRS